MSVPSRRPSTTAGLLLLLALAAAPVARAEGGARKSAAVSLLEGKAERTPAGGAKEALKPGAALVEGDTVSTAAESRLEIKFGDDSVVRLGPSAQLELKAAHFGEGPSKRKMTAHLFFGNIWAKVTSIVGGDQKFQVETENAVAGVRGTTFRVDARSDKSVLVRVYAGAVAVARPVPIYATGRPGERREVAGPEEVTREQWEKLVGKQMQIVIAADGTPGEPTMFADDADKDDKWAKWNEARDEKK